MVARRCRVHDHPARLFRAAARRGAPCSSLYVGIVICLRAAGLLVTDHSIPRLHKRQVVGVFVGDGRGGHRSRAVVAVGVVADNTDPTASQPQQPGVQRLHRAVPRSRSNQIVWPASHNAMSSSAYNFLGAEHTITIPEQLNAGARFLMLDAYYGYDDNGLVRTNLAGGVDREQLEKERGEKPCASSTALGALTGTADTSGKKQDVYFCHDFCELGAVPAKQIFREIDDFLDRNLTDVVIIDFEDYVQPKDLKPALIDVGLCATACGRPSPKQYGWPDARTTWSRRTKGRHREPAPARS